MLLKQAVFKNYRNIEEETIEFSPGVNIIYGDNAQGKTNILEGIYYFSCMKSFRGTRDRDLIRDGALEAKIKISFSDEERDHENEIKFTRGKMKEMRRNGVRQKKMADMLGNFKCVIFAPEHLNLVKEGPSEKRRFMDAALSQLKPGYFSALMNYLKVVEQKNILLKDMQRKPILYETLPLWNEKLSEYAVPIFKMRQEFLESIEKKAVKVHAEISGGNEEISLRYLPAVLEKRKCPEKQEFLEMLKRNEQKEITLGFSLFGPHRDDFEVFINKKDVKTFASQGQQRSAVLSLKTAECELFKDLYHSYPLLLLDDILSELDEKRQEYITENIEKYQVLLTNCEKEKFEKDKGKNLFFMKSGKLLREDGW